MFLTQRVCGAVCRQVSYISSRFLGTSHNSLSRCIQSSSITTQRRCIQSSALTPPKHKFPSLINMANINNLLHRCATSLARMARTGPRKKNHKPNRWMDGRPQMRGVVLRVMIKKPKKPNSANRKCVRVKLSNGTEAIAYVPGEGHNLQEHSIVLVRGGRLQDVPGIHLKCIRGKYDLAHVKKKTM